MRYMKQHKHRHIVQLYEVYESKKYVHLLMPLIPGGELITSLQRKGLYKEEDAKPIMKNFLSGLAYMHEHLIVHRDLKVQNLLLADKEDCGDIKIADFGWCVKKNIFVVHHIVL